jgi:hypothetical protein
MGGLFFSIREAETPFAFLERSLTQFDEPRCAISAAVT